MSLRTVLNAVVEANAALQERIEGRHFRVRAPQGATKPYLVSQIINTDAKSTHGHADDAEDTLDDGLIQFTAVAENADDAGLIIGLTRKSFVDPTEAACAALLATAGMKTTSPNERELPPSDNAGPEPTFIHQLDISIFHNPST